MTEPPPRARRGELLTRWALPLATLAFFVATAEGYGIFRDELYYLACGRHLDWGYVDHPPLVALLAAGARGLFGDSLVGLRLLPALAAAGTVLLVGDTARALGAGLWGRVLAQLLVATAPVYLSLFTIFSMNAFDILVWAGLGRLAVALLGGGADPRLWLAFGALAGIGLQNKLDVGLLGAGFAAGLVVARRWDVLRSRWLWAGGALALALFLPHVVWQAAHGWPTREFVERAQSGKIVHLAPWQFLAAQLELVGPVAAALAAAGLGWLLVARAARPVRALGWAVVAVVAVFSLSISKPYYLAPAYALLFPAAGAALDGWTVGRGRRLARPLVTLAAAAILLAAPLAKPLLPVERFIAYSAAIGFAPGTGERHELGRLPQFFADMHGWRGLAEATATAFHRLPPADRARACVFAQNYGQAGAIDHFGPALGLPPAISGHNSYWLWGPGRCTGEVLLILGGERDDHLAAFRSVEPAGRHRCTNCMPYESDIPIWIARDLRLPLDQAWSEVKHFD